MKVFILYLFYLKTLNMKKTFLSIGLSLYTILNAQSQNLVLNPGFESYSSLPTCPSNHPITYASNWNGLKTAYNGYISCFNGIVNSSGVASNVDYFNQSAGGTSACQTGGPRSGNGYVVLEQRGFYPSSTAYTELIYQTVNNLQSGKQYLISAYVKGGGAASGFSPDYFNAYFVPTSVGTTANAIITNVRSQSTLVGPASNLPNNANWNLYSKVLTVPSTGNYYLVLGNMMFCSDGDNFFSIKWLIDDVSLVLKPCGDAGVNKTNNVAGSCCFIPPNCNPSAVQIGTPTQVGYSYSWLPNNGTLSNLSIAQPNASPCATTVYSLTVSGSNCATNTTTVKVTPIPGLSCACGPGDARMISSSNSSEGNSTLGSKLIEAYPNPTNHFLLINASSDVTEIIIKDVTGKVLKKLTKLDGNSIKLDVSDYAKGIYFIEATTDFSSETQKIMIE